MNKVDFQIPAFKGTKPGIQTPKLMHRQVSTVGMLIGFVAFIAAGVQGATNSFTSNILENEKQFLSGSKVNSAQTFTSTIKKDCAHKKSLIKKKSQPLLRVLEIECYVHRNVRAPKTVVPAVALTKNGTCPLALRSNIRRSSSLVIMRPRSSDATITQLSVPRPQTAAHDFTE
uniref:Uncharacterized protein n=1 Tax=Glossina palpalis gambiensis TaxID=67801 RepID=A0A1B0B7T1_9MUSC